MFFFFNDTATTEIYTLSLHDALPIWRHAWDVVFSLASLLLALLFGVTVANVLRGVPLDTNGEFRGTFALLLNPFALDRKSTRLNSSHANISYAVFCLKKKKTLTTLAR